MKEAKATVEVKKDLKVYVPKTSLRAIGVKEGDFIEIIVRKD
jgi:bifunctional DNA-binding transcriptional regulator/antitoxin component of YhaV-PrlF toxin-antitoxin module